MFAVTTEPTQATEAAPTSCELGRKLGNCALRRAGCGSLYDVLCMVYPPQDLLTELRTRQDLDPTVREWLRTLAKVKP